MRAQGRLTAVIIVIDIDYSAFSNGLGETWHPTPCNRLGSSSLPSACPLPRKASGPWTHSVCVSGALWTSQLSLFPCQPSTLESLASPNSSSLVIVMIVIMLGVVTEVARL